ncbi:MAG TPA: sigma-70 family RNA polymerase sigma factor [Vicinamibacteria bacterium]|nr:sigma-70 family RNA polymerase sigma factor [Vicinamibacteria bacterium]
MATNVIETLLSPLVVYAASEKPGRTDAVREDEREAIEASRRGEREAFDRLVERYQRDVYRLCYRFVNNHEDATDLAQEAFVKAYRALDRFRGDSSFSTWLYRIAVNTCLNFRAARKPPADELPETLSDGRARADEPMESEERARRVRDAIRKLPEKQRLTLILKTYHDLTHEEIAGLMGSTVGTAKANLFHALGNLKRILGEGARG